MQSSNDIEPLCDAVLALVHKQRNTEAIGVCIAVSNWVDCHVRAWSMKPGEDTDPLANGTFMSDGRCSKTRNAVGISISGWYEHLYDALVEFIRQNPSPVLHMHFRFIRFSELYSCDASYNLTGSSPWTCGRLCRNGCLVDTRFSIEKPLPVPSPAAAAPLLSDDGPTTTQLPHRQASLLEISGISSITTAVLYLTVGTDLIWTWGLLCVLLVLLDLIPHKERH